MIYVYVIGIALNSSQHETSGVEDVGEMSVQREANLIFWEISQ